MAAPSDIETQTALSQAALDAASALAQEAENVSAEGHPPIEQQGLEDQLQKKTEEQAKTATTGLAADIKAVLLWQDQIARAPSAPSSPDVARLIARATTLLGQVISEPREPCSSVLSKAAKPQAHFMLAETYDPTVLAKWGALGTRGEAEKARAHYARAVRGQHPRSEKPTGRSAVSSFERAL